ncbi:MAG: glycerophosphoryl diester phosphodiesterase membrane domain-containing protein [Micrococcaceae bacterium]|nr:glycerophosphoryl diester phosphodiesterase membrane domain-containing protein [Micrococcaceae bacterium]
MPIAQPGSLPLRALTLGDYFTALFAAIRFSPGVFFGAALIFGAIAAMLSATGEFLMLRAFGTSLMDPTVPIDNFVSGSGVGFLATTLLSVVTLVLGHVFNWAIYSVMIARSAIGMKTSLSQGFRFLRGQWGRLIGVLALMLAALFVLYIVMILVGVLTFTLIFAGVEPGDFGAIFLGFITSFLMACLPLLGAAYFVTRWLLIVPAMVIEDIGIFAALRRSWRLTRGHFWRTLLISVLFMLIFWFVSYVIMSPLLFVSFFVIMSAGTETELNTTMLIVNFVVSALAQIVGFIVSSMSLLVGIFFYFDYRFRKEGLSLEFQQLAAQHASGNTADRFDTSLEEQTGSNDESNDIIPGRYSAGLQQAPSPGFQQPPQAPGPYGSGPYGHGPHGPPNPPGLY